MKSAGKKLDAERAGSWCRSDSLPELLDSRTHLLQQRIASPNQRVREDASEAESRRHSHNSCSAAIGDQRLSAKDASVPGRHNHCPAAFLIQDGSIRLQGFTVKLKPKD